MQIIHDVVDFCPDVKGDCIGPECAAFVQGIQMLTNVTPLLSKLKHVFEEDIPLALYLDLFHCRKYNKFADIESLEIFKELNLDFEDVENND